MKKNLKASAIFYTTPAVVISTYDENNTPNMTTAGLSGIVSLKPPTIYVSLRKATLAYENIMRDKAFTLNIASEKYVAEVDFAGIVSGKKVNKFLATGLTAYPAELVKAPYIEEFPINLECKLIHFLEIGIHTQFIGEVVGTKANSEVLDENDSPDIEKIRPFHYSDNGKRFYYSLGERLGKAFHCGKKLVKNQDDIITKYF